MTVLIESRKPETSEKIELYYLDLVKLEGPLLRFFVGYDESQVDGSIYFNGNRYLPADLKVEGFEWNGKGTPPTPKLTMATSDAEGNGNGLLLGLLNDYGSLQGAKFGRLRTFKKFLDGQSGASATLKNFSEDIFVVDRKSSENKYFVEFELSSIIDQTNNSLPKGIITDSFCPWIYRKRNTRNTGWDYQVGDHGCPYTGTSMFNTLGQPVTDPLLDKASKRFHSCCLPRYGANAIYPYGGFPGASRPTT